MKLLLAGTIIAVALSTWLGADTHVVTQIQTAGVGEITGMVTGLVKDLWQAAQDSHLGPLHLVVLAVALLVARKILVWLLN